MKQEESNSKLCIIPYIPGYAEYAARVRDEILKRKGSDFIIAVDLPRGLESQVIEATKKLPEASVIVDRLNRGIPILPTSAPIEAVRSYLEYGTDLQFIDTSLPVIGNMDDYQLFANSCILHGIEEVLQKPEQFGIPEKDITKSWISSLADMNYTAPFVHSPSIATAQTSGFEPGQCSPYLLTRLQYMAMKLKELLKEGTDVLLVCSFVHAMGILHFMESDCAPVEDEYTVPSRICTVSEADILHLTYEVPFVMYLYELYRDMPPDRQGWIRSIFSCTEYTSLVAGDAKASTLYSHKLALTDQQLYPDLYNIVAAAKYVVDDEYAFAVFERASSYPPNKNSESEVLIREIVDYNLHSLGSGRVLVIKKKLIGDTRTPRRRWKKKDKKITPGSYSRWTRTLESQQNEREFMRYVTSRFTFKEPSEDQFVSEECVCGLGEGFDVRETIRNWNSKKIYYKEPVMENTACYVMDYRTFNQVRRMGGAQENLEGTVSNEGLPGSYLGNIFFDKQYPMIGVAYSQNDHYEMGVLAAFTKLAVPSTQIFCNIRSSQPLKTAVETGLEYTKTVFVFTDSPEELEGIDAGSDRVKILPTQIIPYSVFEKMSTFDVAYHRYDNRRGD